MSKYDDYESDWIIAVANTAADGTSVYRFRGTADKVKAKLAKKDMENDPDNICGGCSREFSVYIEYSDYHITYQAIQLCQIDFI